MRSASAVAKMLSDAGWKVELADPPLRFPEAFLQRYAWVPAPILALHTGLRSAVSPDEKLWLVTAADVLGVGDGAFRADELEALSLDAALGMENETNAILRFWDRHFVLVFSVKKGSYTYFALDRGTQRVVTGRDPEFEETRSVADDHEGFLDRLIELGR